MKALIAPVSDQSASSVPETINSTLVSALELICLRLEPNRSSTCAGTAPCSEESRLSIVAPGGGSGKVPTATRSSEGIAKKVEYERADASSGTWLASADLAAASPIWHHSRTRRSRM